MAQSQYSEIGITGLRGRIGGSQFTRVISGQQTTLPTIPRQANSSYQQEAQKRFRDIVKAWKELSDSDRETWVTAAASGDWEKENSLGEVYNPTGFNLFCELNLNVYDQVPKMTTAPSYPSFTTNALIDTRAFNTGSLDLTFSALSISSREKVVVYATKGISPGRMSLKQSEFREIMFINDSSYAEIFAAGTEYSARFGAQSIGSAIFTKCLLMNMNSGARMDMGTLKCIVQELM